MRFEMLLIDAMRVCDPCAVRCVRWWAPRCGSGTLVNCRCGHAGGLTGTVAGIDRRSFLIRLLNLQINLKMFFSEFSKTGAVLTALNRTVQHHVYNASSKNYFCGELRTLICLWNCGIW